MLPHVVLIGDSIRLAYQPLVADLLNHCASVVGPADNCETSAKILANLDEWVVRHQPDIVHINCGLHDLKRLPNAADCLVPLNEYRHNLESIFTILQRHTSAKIIWATITPVDEVRHQAWKTFLRKKADVDAYNTIGCEVARSFGVRINDLHAIPQHTDLGRLLHRDGVHFGPEGTRLLAKGVATMLDSELAELAPRRQHIPKGDLL